MEDKKEVRDRTKGDYILCGDTVYKIENDDCPPYILNTGQTVNAVNNITINRNILLACGFSEEKDQFVLKVNDKNCNIVLKPLDYKIEIKKREKLEIAFDLTTKNINTMVLSELQYILRKNCNNYELETNVDKLNAARK